MRQRPPPHRRGGLGRGGRLLLGAAVSVLALVLIAVARATSTKGRVGGPRPATAAADGHATARAAAVPLVPETDVPVPVDPVAAAGDGGGGLAAGGPPAVEIPGDLSVAADGRPPAASGSDDVQLFVIWHGAWAQREKILRDVATRFIVLAATVFDWPAWTADGELNLWRLYSGKGGWARRGMPLKVRQCGAGPFIALVVLDPAPEYRDEATAHGTDRVSHNMNTAKKLYRRWSHGGFHVHGTFNPAEADHDVAILFHQPKAAFLAAYRVSAGRAAVNVGGRFLGWLRRQRVRRHAPTGRVVQQEDGRLEWREGTAGLDQHAGGQPGVDGGVAVRLGVSDGVYHPPRRPRVGPLSDQHPDGADPAAAAAAAATGRATSLESMATTVAAPFYTQRLTLGYGGDWPTCAALALALSTLPVRLFEPLAEHGGAAGAAGAAATPLERQWECAEWPEQLHVAVAQADVFALSALLAEQPDSHAAMPVSHVVRFGAGRAPVTLHLHLDRPQSPYRLVQQHAGG